MSVFDSLKSKNRLVHLDLLRGFFIVLAIYQHFGGYLNYWMVYYFRESKDVILDYYPNFGDYIGVRLPMDEIAYWFSMIFTPWVSHVYLALAAINLASKKGDDFKSAYPKKMKNYAVLFFFFSFENFCVATNLGDALTFYPLMAWMCILMMIASVYRFLGLIGVLCLCVINYMRFFWASSPDLGDLIVAFFQEWIHPDFNYESRIEYFLETGCLGFLMGYVLHHVQVKKIHLVISSLCALSLIGCFFIFGPSISVERLDAYATEHDLAKDWLGMLYLLSVQALVIGSFVYAEARGLVFKIRWLEWVGVSSLLIFGLHRVFFVHVAGPIWAWFRGVYFETVPVNSSWEIWLIMAIFFVICRSLQKSQILRLLVR